MTVHLLNSGVPHFNSQLTLFTFHAAVLVLCRRGLCVAVSGHHSNEIESGFLALNGVAGRQISAQRRDQHLNCCRLLFSPRLSMGGQHHHFVCQCRSRQTHGQRDISRHLLPPPPPPPPLSVCRLISDYVGITHNLTFFAFNYWINRES